MNKKALLIVSLVFVACATILECGVVIQLPDAVDILWGDGKTGDATFDEFLVARSKLLLAFAALFGLAVVVGCSAFSVACSNSAQHGKGP